MGEAGLTEVCKKRGDPNELRNFSQVVIFYGMILFHEKKFEEFIRLISEI